MKTSLTVLLLLIYLPVFSQEMETYNISIQENPSATMEKMRWEIIKNEDENFLIRYKQKKQRLSLSDNDSLRVATLMKKNNQESKDELISIIEKTKAFEIDSLQISKEDPIFKVTDSFYKNRQKLKKNAEEKKDKRIILDGIMYKITVADLEGGSFTYYAQSPSEKSHPEIFNLISVLKKTYTELKN